MNIKTSKKIRELQTIKWEYLYLASNFEAPRKERIKSLGIAKGIEIAINKITEKVK